MEARNQSVHYEPKLSEIKRHHLKNTFVSLTHKANLIFIAEQLYILNHKLKMIATPNELQSLIRHVASISMIVILINKLAAYMKSHRITISSDKEAMIAGISEALDSLLETKQHMSKKIEDDEVRYTDSVSSLRGFKKIDKPLLRWHTVGDVNTFFREIKLLDDARKHIEKLTLNAVVNIMQHDLLISVVEKDCHDFDEERVKYYSQKYAVKSSFKNALELIYFIREFTEWASVHSYRLNNIQTGLDLIEAIAGILFNFAKSHKFDGHAALADAEIKLERFLPMTSNCDIRIFHFSNLIDLMNNTDRFARAVISTLPKRPRNDEELGIVESTLHKRTHRKDWKRIKHRNHQRTQSHASLFSINWREEQPTLKLSRKNPTRLA